MQSPDLSQTYFELFGINPAFDIDCSRLHAEQQRLQAVYHPDRYVSASEHDKRASVQVASWVNQAYETLQDPVKRSRYLLEISGADIPDDSTTTSDTEFLMEQIELREQVESCRHGEVPAWRRWSAAKLPDRNTAGAPSRRTGQGIHFSLYSCRA
jgi:molecular chaperone HscB